MSNVLDLVDHAIFSLERAAGTTSLIQCIWTCDGPVDLDGLSRFHDHLRRGRLNRRIELSPLPFGRHRWALASTHSDLEIAVARPRADFDAWLVEQAATPLDAERGPGWHLAVLPFADGGAGVSLVVSHCITDAVGLCEALADAATGRCATSPWPEPGSRPRLRALREDVGQSLRDVPGIARAVAAAARLVRNAGGAPAPVAPSVADPGSSHDDVPAIPTTTVFVDTDEWDARAAALGGTSNTLLAGVAARLGRRVARTSEDGSVTLPMPVSRRGSQDTRANAITNVDITVDPAPATTDLRGIRAATKLALTRADTQPDERWTLLPLIPLTPERLRRQWVGAATNSAASIGASNVGDVDRAVRRPDGTEAQHFAMRSLCSGTTAATLHAQGGVLSVLSGRAGRRMFVSAVGYQPGRPNSTVQQDVVSVLEEFGLTATAGWSTAAHNAHNSVNRH